MHSHEKHVPLNRLRIHLQGMKLGHNRRSLDKVDDLRGLHKHLHKEDGTRER